MKITMLGNGGAINDGLSYNSFMIGETEKLQAIKTEGCIFFFRNSNILAAIRRSPASEVISFFETPAESIATSSQVSQMLEFVSV